MIPAIISTITLDSLVVTECPFSEITEFVEMHHYSKSTKGITSSFCYKVTSNSHLVGAAVFGRPAMRQTIDKYSQHGRSHLVELRRFCMIDQTPRNSESRVLGIMIRLLRKKRVDRILSYADPNHGHLGIIYKATGFICLGQTAPITVIWYNNRRYPIRNIDQRNPDSTLYKFAAKLRQAIADGTAVQKRETGKFIYIRDLQASWVHRIKKETASSGPRINLTFRMMPEVLKAVRQ